MSKARLARLPCGVQSLPNDCRLRVRPTTVQRRQRGVERLKMATATSYHSLLRPTLRASQPPRFPLMSASALRLYQSIQLDTLSSSNTTTIPRSRHRQPSPDSLTHPVLYAQTPLPPYSSSITYGIMPDRVAGQVWHPTRPPDSLSLSPMGAHSWTVAPLRPTPVPSLGADRHLHDLRVWYHLPR